jgi:hypothetical protein
LYVELPALAANGPQTRYSERWVGTLRGEPDAGGEAQRDVAGTYCGASAVARLPLTRSDRVEVPVSRPQPPSTATSAPIAMIPSVEVIREQEDGLDGQTRCMSMLPGEQ